MTAEQPAGPVRLSVNCVVGGVWIAAGDPLPFSAPGDVPETLKPFIAEEEPDEPQGPPSLNFAANRIYNTNAEGAILSRHGRRDAARLAGEAARQELAEEEALREAELPEETREALQAEHDNRIGVALATAELHARNRDAAIEEAQRKADAEQKPADPFYVRRGAKLRPGEQVFVKEPSGAWAAVGTVNSTGELPPTPEVI